MVGRGHTGYYEPAFWGGEVGYHGTVRCYFGRNSADGKSVVVLVVGRCFQSLDTNPISTARPKLPNLSIRKPNIHPTRRLNDIHKRLQALRNRRLRLLRILPTLIQTHLIHKVRHSLAQVLAAVHLEEGGDVLGLPWLLLGLVEMKGVVDGFVGGVVEEPDGVGGGVDFAGERVVVAEIGTQVVEEGDAGARGGGVGGDFCAGKFASRTDVEFLLHF